MCKAIAFTPIFLFTILTSSVLVCHASIFGVLPPEALFRESDLVVTGTIVDLTSRWGRGEGEDSIVTVVSLEIEGVVKGTVTGEGIIEFTYPGGRVGDTMIWVEDQPSFKLGEHVLMYLKEGNSTSWGGPKSYTLTSGTFMGKSDTTSNTTIGMDGEQVTIEPFRVVSIDVSIEQILAPFIALTLFTFFLINWANLRK
jgi:hypothetical protein